MEKIIIRVSKLIPRAMQGDQISIIMLVSISVVAIADTVWKELKS